MSGLTDSSMSTRSCLQSRKREERVKVSAGPQPTFTTSFCRSVEPGHASSLIALTYHSWSVVIDSRKTLNRGPIGVFFLTVVVVGFSAWAIASFGGSAFLGGFFGFGVAPPGNPADCLFVPVMEIQIPVMGSLPPDERQGTPLRTGPIVAPDKRV